MRESTFAALEWAVCGRPSAKTKSFSSAIVDLSLPLSLPLC
jgi:hypothetical protein